MVLEPENINLYELTLEIKRKGGLVLDLKTDCVVCEFEKFPFKMDDSNNIIGFYHYQEHIVHNAFKASKVYKNKTYECEYYSWSCMRDP